MPLRRPVTPEATIRLGAVPPEVGEIRMTAQLAGGVQASADDERAGARDHLDSISGLVEELVGLNLGILKTLRDVPVRWKHRDGKARECSRQHSVTIGEQRLVLWCMRRVARRNSSCVGTCRNLRHERRG